MAPLPDRIFLQLRRAQDFKVHRVVEIVTVISDLIRQVRDLRFERWTAIFLFARCGRIIECLMFSQTFPHFEGQIKAGKIRVSVLKQLHYAQALPIMIEPAMFLHTFRQHFFAGMPEG